MGILWAISWAFGGVAIGAASLVTPWLPWEAFFRVYDAPLPTLAIPGFVGGLLFAGVLRVSARRRPLRELSTRQFALWGAIGGMILAVIPDLLLAGDLISAGAGATALMQLTTLIATPLVSLSSLTAALTFQIAKRVPDPLPLEGHEEMLDLVRELKRERSASPSAAVATVPARRAPGEEASGY